MYVYTVIYKRQIGCARSRPCVSRFWYRLYSHVGFGNSAVCIVQSDR